MNGEVPYLFESKYFSTLSSKNYTLTFAAVL